MALRTVAAVVAGALVSARVAAWNNGAALTPPMGFANWNRFGCDYDDALLRQVADALAATGLAARGYEYVLVQECIVPAGHRDPVTHVLQPDPAKFPHGLQNLTAFFHARGLKAGVYTDVAAITCAGYEGSGPSATDPVGHWPLDALTFAQWGFDMIEADFCNTEGVNLTAYELYKAARDAIAAASAATNRTIAFYQCNWGQQDPWLWAPEVSNLFRSTRDICAPGSIEFANILYNFDNTIVHSGTPPSAPGLPGTGIGAWLDPDMLGVGMPGITDTEGRTQFSLWCILGAPLLLGTDVRNMSDFTLATIGNAEAIAIDQDALGVQGYLVPAASPGSPPVPWGDGGLLLNLTACAGSDPSAAPSRWQLTSDGHIIDAAGAAGGNGSCLTVYDCGSSGLGSVVFSYACFDNACGNELWTWQPATGRVVSSLNATFCLTGAAAGASVSQLTVDTCDGRPGQAWTWDAQGHLSLASVPGAGAGPVCLTELSQPLEVYAKPLAPIAPGRGQDVALAVLNRGPTALPGAVIELSLFSFAPSQRVMVRDIWQATTVGPFSGSFTTRGLASHETLLLRMSLA